MSGFLETLVARGAGLPAPDGQVQLLPRPLARFEPGGGGWQAAGGAGPGPEAPFAPTESTPAEHLGVLSAAVAAPRATRSMWHEGTGESGFRGPSRPRDEPRPLDSPLRDQAVAAAPRPKVPAESTWPSTNAAPVRGKEASDDVAAPPSIDAARAVSFDGAAPERPRSEPRTNPAAPSPVAATPIITADPRAAALASAERRSAPVAAAPPPPGHEAPPPISISIGRVTVEVVEPAPTPPAVQRPPGPPRTRGFEAYARARRGHLR